MRAVSCFSRCPKLHRGARAAPHFLLFPSFLRLNASAAGRRGCVEYKTFGTHLGRSDKRGSLRKAVRAPWPLTSRATVLSLPYTSIHRQPRDRPVGDGNSRIIPISSGNFVAQFVSRKEYDITRTGRIASTTQIALCDSADGRSACETVACPVNNRTRYPALCYLSANQISRTYSIVSSVRMLLDARRTT